MSTAQLNTLLRQAQSFLQAREAEDAIRLLEQARMLARDDNEALATIYALQAKGQAMWGRGDNAVALARQALQLDPAMEVHLEAVAAELDARGQDANADTIRHMRARGHAQPTRGRRKTGWVVACSAIVIAATIGCLVYFDVISLGGGARGGSETARLDFERIRKNVGLVVVSAKYTYIDGHSVNRPLAMGSCFAVSADGVLLTNRHVTESREDAPEDERDDNERLLSKRDSWTIKVCFGPDELDQFDARLVYESPYRDVAVLKIDRRFPSYLRMAHDWAPGDDVYAAGFPGAVSAGAAEKDMSEIIRKTTSEMDKADADMSTVLLSDAAYEVTITRGVISAIREFDDQPHVQTDAVITSGNSGGPLLTRNCNVVGVNTLQTRQSEAYNYALALKDMLEELKPFVVIR